jgi:energy-coupling factor transport system substrate-specific component
LSILEPRSPETPGTTDWDPLKQALQTYRDNAGSPSYAEIAKRIAAARQAAGMDEFAARVARTTIYDALQPGKRRVNLPLLREIGIALGATEREVDAWIGACHKPVPDPAQVLAVPAAGQPAPSDAGASVDSLALPEPAAPPPWRVSLLVMVGCLVVNIVGGKMVDLLPIDLYLDTIGTAIAALVLGPWRGAVVGYGYSAFSAYVLGFDHLALAFGLVEVACALVWGYGVRARGGRSLVHYFVLSLVVSVVATAVAAPILVAANGVAEHRTDALFRAIEHDGHSELFSIFAGNLWTSVWDKVLSSMVALVVVSALPMPLRRRFPLAVAIGRLGKSTNAPQR